MYDATNIPDGTSTTFYYHTTGWNVNANAFRTDEGGNNYWNNRSDYLALWNSSAAVGNDAGSAFVFEEITLDNYKNKCAVLTGKDRIGTGLFYYPQTVSDQVDAILSEEGITEEPTTVEGWFSLYQTLQNEALQAKIKAVLQSFNKPVAGKNYAIQNYTGSYMYAGGVTAGSYINAQNALSLAAVWTLEAGDSDGQYRFKNKLTGLYITGKTGNASTNFTLGEIGGETEDEFAMQITSNNLAGTVTIGDLPHPWYYRPNTNNLISWEEEDKTNWKFVEIADDEYVDLLFGYYQDLYGILPGATEGAAYTKALDVYNSNRTVENAKSVCNAMKANVENNYYRFQSYATDRTNTMGVNADQTGAKTYDMSKSDAGLVWKLVPVEDGFKLQNVNSGKYLGPVEGGKDKNASLFDLKEGAKFTISKNSDGAFILKDGNGRQVFNETNGNLNYWFTGDASVWHIYQATDIEVLLTAAGDAAYATTYLPFAVSEVSGATAYTGAYNAANSTLDMTETTAIPANTGVVLKGTADATTAVLTIGEAAEATSGLTGTLTPITLADDTRANYLVLGTNEGAIGFYKPSANVASIPANKAYLANATQATQAVALNFGGTPTGITGIEAADGDSNAPVYDITGRRVNGTAKGGIYIQNGRKFIVK